MALVSPQRPAVGSRGGRRSRRSAAPSGHRGPARYVALTILLLLVGLAAAAAIMFSSAKGSLTSDPAALAKIGMPLGGGRIESVSVTTGPHDRAVGTVMKGHQIWPARPVPAGERLAIEVVLRRPGWIAWLAGKTERLTLTVTAPTATVTDRYLTVKPDQPLTIRFSQPVASVSYGPAGQLRRHDLPTPQTELTLDRTTDAGTIWVVAMARTWERAGATMISWFPAGVKAAAVALPAPGSRIGPATPITLTFSKPVQQALGSSRPPVLPTTQGTWHTLSSHTIVFRPEGYGYGLGAKVTIPLPAGVRLVGASSSSGTWTVPAGSPLREQQLLAMLGYLPLDFKYRGAHPASTPAAQETAAVDPPAGTFVWRYGNVPSALRSFWQAGASGVMTRGAVMAFENDHGLGSDGVAGPQVWRALIAAAVSGHRSTFGYAFVSVDESSQTLNLWHNGHTVLTTPVNTGIPSRPTQPGTFPVYEHISSGTMSGTNPNGTKYHDPGIPWISYFNGGDALHGFTRAQYGFPQSLGCVEMPVGTAGQVWPYTPIGTLVHVV